MSLSLKYFVARLKSMQANYQPQRLQYKTRPATTVPLTIALYITVQELLPQI